MAVGDYLKDGLIKLQDKYDCIGLMIGVEIVESKQMMKQTAELRHKIEKSYYDRGLLIFGGGGVSVIRWAPPLILTKENVDVALEIFDQAIKASI